LRKMDSEAKWIQPFEFDQTPSLAHCTMRVI